MRSARLDRAQRVASEGAEKLLAGVLEKGLAPKIEALRAMPMIGAFLTDDRIADIEQAIGIPVYAQIRSAGPIMVRAANEGRTLVEFVPGHGITGDFGVLADKIIGRSSLQPAKAAFKLFGRSLPARA